MKHLNAFTVRYSCDDEWLDGKMYQITNCLQHQLVDGNYPVITIDNFNDLNKYADDSDWMFVQMSGDYIVDRDHIWNKLHSIPENVGLIGHILWDKSESCPRLHQQCIIINTRALKGEQLDFYSKTTKGKDFTRSELSMHGDYCPIYVNLVDKEIERESSFGTDVMEMILSNGYDVVNFDHDWRKNTNLDYIDDLPSRGFLNPDIDTEKFAKCFKTLTIEDDLDPAQKDAINVIKQELDYNWLNALHWDGFPKGNNAKLIISPANGFMGECMAVANNCSKVIFYDINKNNIDFKKKLYTEWDGKDYESYYTAFANERHLNIDPQTPSAKENAKKQMQDVNYVIDNWEKIKKLDVEFIHGDLIDMTAMMVDKITDHTVFHTSTILNFYVWSNIKHDRVEIEKTRQQIQNKINETNSLWFETY